MEMGFDILNFIQEHLRCDFLDTIMPYISWIDNRGRVWIICGFLLCLTKRYRKYGILLLLCLLVGVLLNSICLKPMFERPRPCWINTDIDLLINTPRDYSFPSGHSLSSATAAAVIMMADRKLGAAAAVLAILIMFSRLYLYVHFPGDIIGGMVFGVLIAVIGNEIMKRLIKRKTEKI